MNSFKLLEDEDGLRLFQPERKERIRDKVQGRLETMRFLGTILEMYVPVMADTVTNLTGGEGRSLYADELPEDFEFPDTDFTSDENQLPPSGPVIDKDDDNLSVR